MNVKNYTPLWRHVVIKDVTEEKTKTGIFLPNEAEGVMRSYEIVKTSNDCESVKEGNIVIIDEKFASPSPLLFEDQGECAQIREQQVIGIIK